MVSSSLTSSFWFYPNLCVFPRIGFSKFLIIYWTLQGRGQRRRKQRDGKMEAKLTKGREGDGMKTGESKIEANFLFSAVKII
jgi:hypothetical protein